MLLNYLFENFYEERDFANVANMSMERLDRLMEYRIVPRASYILKNQSSSQSFVSNFTDTATYRFHLKGHLDWAQVIELLNLDTEDRARVLFQERYQSAKRIFLSGGLGMELVTFAQDIPENFDRAHADSTWENFLNGVYGVCTRDGQPETVFFKQVAVMFIERLTVSNPTDLKADQLRLLHRVVTFLDTVESSFAPHEASETSRQRCIVDIKARYFTEDAA